MSDIVTYTLHSSSAAVAVGDVVCLPNATSSGKVTKATSAALASGGIVVGIAVTAANPSNPVDVNVCGVVLNADTGLGNGTAGAVYVNSSARCTRTATARDYLVGSCDAVGNVRVSPIGVIDTHNVIGAINVKAFGAVADNSTDCSDAFERAISTVTGNPAVGARNAPIVFVPPGQYYLSRSLEVNQPIQFVGAGTGTTTSSTLRFAAGKGLRFNDASADPDGVGSGYSVMRGITVECAQLTVNTWQASHAYVVGDRVRIPSANTAFKFKRLAFHYVCTRAGTSGGTEPAWKDVFGPEAFAWTASTVRRKGDYVKPTTPNGKVYICTVAGTTSGTEPVWPTTTGTTVTDGTTTWKCKGNDSNDTFTDGTVTWTCTAAPGIRIMVRTNLEHVSVRNATDAGVHIQADHAYEVWPSNANLFQLSDVTASGCTHGLYVRGSDANAGQATMFSGESGTGCGVLDESFLGNAYYACHVASTAMSPYVSTSGSASLFNCYSESGSPPSEWAGAVYGGMHGSWFASSSSNPLFMNPVSYNISVANDRGGMTKQINFGYPGNNDLYTWEVGDDLYRHAFSYNTPGTGWWAISYGGPKLAFSGTRAAEGSNGLLWMPHGVFEGDDTVSDGAKYFRAARGSFLTDVDVRNGKREKGDRVELPGIARGGYIGRAVTTAGNVGPAWTASRTVYQRIEIAPGLKGANYRADTVQPTTAKANGYAYICTKDGTTGGTEPTWPTTVGQAAYTWKPSSYRSVNTYARPTTPNGFYYRANTGGTTGSTQPTWPTTVGATVVDNGVTWQNMGSDAGTYVVDGTAIWTCIGPVPAWSDYGFIPEKGSVQTTNNTTTVLDSFPLADTACTMVSVDVTAYQTAGTSSPDAASFVLRGSWRRSGGAPVQVGAPTVVVSNPNANGAAWTAVLALNGNNVEVRVTGDTGKTVTWKSIRQAT